MLKQQTVAPAAATSADEGDVEAADGRDAEHSGTPVASGSSVPVQEADAACKAGNTVMASEKAKAAMELLKK